MGLTNIYAKLIVVAVLLPVFTWGQTTVIPDKLRVKTVPRSPAIKDMMVTVDTLGNIKKDTIPSGGGGSANGVNGLTGTGNIGLGGTLVQNTTINTGGFNWIFNNATNGNSILQLQSNGNNVITFDVAGNIHANGLAMLSSPNNGLIDLSGSRVSVLRNTANATGAFTVAQLNTGSTGHIIDLQNPYYATWSLGINGQIIHTPLVPAATGVAMGYSMVGGLKPTANGDVLVGVDLHPVFGTSTISSVGSLVGGSGYPNGTKLSNVSGGTGQQAVIQCTVSGGIVTGISLISGGINYTNGDVLNIVITDSNGNPVGSGGSVTVSGVTSYTGTTNYALRTWGLDQYGSDLSSNYTLESKTSKRYVDSRVISNTYTAVGSSTTTFTVTIGTTQPNNTYKVQVTAGNALTTTVIPYVTNKTTTTFDVVFPAGLTGATKFDWTLTQ